MTDDQILVDLPGAQAIFTTKRNPLPGEPFTGLWLVQSRQVHGTQVEHVDELSLFDFYEPIEADGQATTLLGVAPMVRVADCLPVALAGGGAVAMLHCGWRGLAGGIIVEGVAAIHKRGEGGEIAAALGPSARGCCYEVGEEVRGAFAAYPGAFEGNRLDLAAVAREQLEAAGVGEIHDTGLCTICSDPDLFFSYRRDKTAGRQVGAVRLL